MAKLLQSQYVIMKLDVMEQPDKKALENAGGMDLMKLWGGEKAGLPFMVVLDPDGKKLIDSNRPVEGKPAANTGYPATPEEIGWFITMVKKTSKLSDTDQANMEKWLKEHAPKAGS
jgi:hypothetical protein